VVVRTATNPGGDAGDKTPSGPVDLLPLFLSADLACG
jgi:hypothetical protein